MLQCLKLKFLFDKSPGVPRLGVNCLSVEMRMLPCRTCTRMQSIILFLEHFCFGYVSSNLERKIYVYLLVNISIVGILRVSYGQHFIALISQHDNKPTSGIISRIFMMKYEAIVQFIYLSTLGECFHDQFRLNILHLDVHYSQWLLVTMSDSLTTVLLSALIGLFVSH